MDNLLIRRIPVFMIPGSVSERIGKYQFKLAVFFASKFITGFGYLVAGPFLDMIGLEAGAQPGTVPTSVIWGLGVIMGPGLGLLMLIPVWMSFKLRVSLAGQLAVQKALLERAAGVKPV